MKTLLCFSAVILVGNFPLQAQENSLSLPARAGGTLSDPAVVVDLPDAPTPRLRNGTPDLSGLWMGGGPTRDIAVGLMPGERIILLPEAEMLMKSRLSKDDPEASCLPTGVPRIAPYPWRIVQAPQEGKATHLFF
ncbi:uncharacterized protein METZ01_LOCUS488111, partial [marine metagenome]